MLTQASRSNAKVNSRHNLRFKMDGVYTLDKLSKNGLIGVDKR